MPKGLGAQWSRRILPVALLCGWAVTGWAQTQSAGPKIVFFGITRADDLLVDPSGTDPNGLAIYDRPFGSSFSLVVEAKKGDSGLAVARQTFSDAGCPDLQVQVSRPLGDGSPAVCDTIPPEDGGVPAIDPADVGDDPQNCNALNDLGCRFIDGAGSTEGRLCNEGCVLFTNGEFGCAAPDTQVQFCGRIAKSAEFPVGDTVVTARVRDTQGTLGPPVQIIVRIAPPPPTITPKPTPTPTPVPPAQPTVYVKSRGCAIVPVGDETDRSMPLVLLIPAALLWAGRRLTAPRSRP